MAKNLRDLKADPYLSDEVELSSAACVCARWQPTESEPGDVRCLTCGKLSRREMLAAHLAMRLDETLIV
jgi:hypothetical protein